jgi:NAD(P)-dependent dehydrogenase (short-subunit alcohol dehydrogenase family)
LPLLQEQPEELVEELQKFLQLKVQNRIYLCRFCRKSQNLEDELSAVTQIKGYQSDASDYDAAQKLVEDVVAEFGKIDILVNNAGITRDNLMLRMSKEDWDTIIKVNLDSVFNLTKAVIKPMMKAEQVLLSI